MLCKAGTAACCPVHAVFCLASHINKSKQHAHRGTCNLLKQSQYAQGIDHTVLDKLLSMVSVDFGAEIPLFPLERLQEGDFLQSAVDCSKLFADQQFDVLEVAFSATVNLVLVCAA